MFINRNKFCIEVYKNIALHFDQVFKQKCYLHGNIIYDNIIMTEKQIDTDQKNIFLKKYSEIIYIPICFINVMYPNIKEIVNIIQKIEGCKDIVQNNKFIYLTKDSYQYQIIITNRNSKMEFYRTIDFTINSFYCNKKLEIKCFDSANFDLYKSHILNKMLKPTPGFLYNLKKQTDNLHRSSYNSCSFACQLLGRINRKESEKFSFKEDNIIKINTIPHECDICNDISSSWINPLCCSISGSSICISCLQSHCDSVVRNYQIPSCPFCRQNIVFIKN